MRRHQLSLEVAKVHSVKAPVWDRFFEPNWVIQLGVSEKLGHPHPQEWCMSKTKSSFPSTNFRVPCLTSGMWSFNVCKASRKWHTSKSQPPFTCDCGVSSSGSRTLSVGGAPQAREVCVVPQEQCGVVTLCDLPGPPEPLHHCLKRNGIKRKKINTSLTLPWQRHRLPQGGANVFWIQDPPFPKKVTGGCPCCLATGQYPQLPKFLESEPTYENKAWDLLSEQDQSL